jgi:hypothetical protein
MKKLKPIEIGYRYFTESVDITDPCYRKDVWCRMNDVKVKPGEYKCVTWMRPDTYTYEGKTYDDTRVAIIGIYLNGLVPNEDYMEEIGEIGVDAGLAGFFNNKPDYNDDEWSEFCDSIRDGCAWIKDEGFFSSSGYGDGCYPVNAFRMNGEIVALEIRFI